jgi:hypothetical protein
MSSGFPLKADFTKYSRHFAFVPASAPEDFDSADLRIPSVPQHSSRKLLSLTQQKVETPHTT